MNDLDQGNQAHERIIERNRRLQGEENQEATPIGSQSRNSRKGLYTFLGTTFAIGAATIALVISNYKEKEVELTDKGDNIAAVLPDSSETTATSLAIHYADSAKSTRKDTIPAGSVLISQRDYEKLKKEALKTEAQITPAKSDTVRVTERDTIRIEDYTKYIAQHPKELSQNRFSWGRLAGGWVKWANMPLPHKASLETRAEAIANNYTVLDSFETLAPGFVKSQIGSLAILAGYSSLTGYTNRQGVLEFIPTDLDGRTLKTIRYLPPEMETK